MLEYWSNGILANQGEMIILGLAYFKSSFHYSTIPLLQKAKIPQSTRGGKQR